VKVILIETRCSKSRLNELAKLRHDFK